jgi:hypothetical protein
LISKRIGGVIIRQKCNVDKERYLSLPLKSRKSLFYRDNCKKGCMENQQKK